MAQGLAVQNPTDPRKIALRRRRRVLRVVLIAVLSVFIVVAGYGLLVFRPVLVLHTADPTIGHGNPGGATVGSALPSISGVDYANTKVSVNPAAGPVTLVFIAHWCEYCKAEIQSLHAALLRGSYEPVEPLFAVSTRHLPFLSWPPSEVLKLQDFPGKVIVDTDSSLASYFQIRTTPTWYFTDSNGLIAKIVTGTLTPEEVNTYAKQASQIQ